MARPKRARVGRTPRASDVGRRERTILGDRLRSARIAAGYAVASEAARKLDMPVHQLYRIEDGSRLPTYPTLLRLVVGLGLDVEPLFRPVPPPPGE